MANGNVFSDYLEGTKYGQMSPGLGQMALSQMDPLATYRSSEAGRQFVGGAGTKKPRAQARSRFMEGAYQDVYSDYLGEVGRAFREGKSPTTFKDYLESDVNGTDVFTKRYMQTPMSQRRSRVTNPSTRFIFY